VNRGDILRYFIMRIYVHDPGNHFDEHTRGYAEYRVRSTLATVANDVHHAIITLAPLKRDEALEPGDPSVTCSVSVRLKSGEQMDRAAYGQDPYEAVDRAAHRIVFAVETSTTRLDPAAA
jgi:hypothetical protein